MNNTDDLWDEMHPDSLKEPEERVESEQERMARAMDYDPSTQRDEDGPWGGGFARNN